jgi:hypothetical protein
MQVIWVMREEEYFGKSEKSDLTRGWLICPPGKSLANM